MSVRESLDRYLSGPARLRESLQGLTEAELAYKYDPAKWSAKEIAMHVADMDQAGVFRMKRIISEERPSYPGVDQELWAAGLLYQDRELEPALRMFEATRAELGAVLVKLPESAWSRVGIHSERGEQTLQGIMEGYIGHLDTHIGQIEAIRRRLGK